MKFAMAIVVLYFLVILLALFLLQDFAVLAFGILAMPHVMNSIPFGLSLAGQGDEGDEGGDQPGRPIGFLSDQD